jgi:hypothetical protein
MAGCGALWKAKGFPEKMRMAPCRASIRLPFPTPPGKLCAPRHGRCTGHGVARGELATGRCAACNRIHDEPVFRIRHDHEMTFGAWAETANTVTRRTRRNGQRRGGASARPPRLSVSLRVLRVNPPSPAVRREVRASASGTLSDFAALRAAIRLRSRSTQTRGCGSSSAAAPGPATPRAALPWGECAGRGGRGPGRPARPRSPSPGTRREAAASRGRTSSPRR